MKTAILLAMATVVTCTPLRDKRSYATYAPAHYGSSYIIPDDSYIDHDHVYSPHAAPPVYYVPGRREVHTTTATHYTVHVPVTYTYHIEQPVHRSTVYSVPSPVTTYYGAHGAHGDYPWGDDTYSW